MTLTQIFSTAHVGMRIWEPGVRLDPIIDIARGLVSMRQAGLLRAVYIDEGVIRISYGKNQRRSITHDEAAKIVNVYRKGEV